MGAKLTLNINESTIIKAKIVAKRNRTSVSKIVEEYLDRISNEKKNSVVDLIIKNAPVIKTKPGTEKKILISRLKAKYGS